MDGIAFDLVFHAVRVDDQAAVVRHQHALHAHGPAGGIHLQLGNTRHEGLIVLVPPESHAASVCQFFRLAPPGGVRLPAGLPGSRLQDLARALIRQVAQAEFQRVHARRGRQLIHERFVGEGILRPAQAAEGGRPQGRVSQVMDGHALVREGIVGRGIAFGAKGKAEMRRSLTVDQLTGH